MVRVSETCGSAASRAAMFFASGSDGANTLIAFAPVLGSLFKSRKVATASTSGFCRCKGLKSKCTRSSKGDAASTIASVTTSIGMR